jgi:hypothetical protein
MSRIAGTRVEREGLLSAERAARGELVAAGQAKDEFLATISHELRTPLNAILGWATLLQRPRVDASTINDGLKVIERNARAQAQLLGDLLDANQLMSGKLSLTFEPMDLNEAVRATLDSMRVSIAARKVRIEAQVSEDPLPVMGDSVRLQQIVTNLLSNAIKFRRPTASCRFSQAPMRTWPAARCATVARHLLEFLPHIREVSSGDGGGAQRLPVWDWGSPSPGNGRIARRFDAPRGSRQGRHVHHAAAAAQASSCRSANWCVRPRAPTSRSPDWHPGEDVNSSREPGGCWPGRVPISCA